MKRFCGLGAALGTVAIVAASAGVAQARDIIVPNYGSDSVTIIDSATGDVTHTVSLPNGPWFSVVSPDGKTAYVVEYKTDTLVPINLSTFTTGTPITISSGEDLNQIAISPNGEMLYAVNYDTDTLIPVNLTTGAVGTPIPAGADPEGIAIAPNGATGYVADSGNGSTDTGEVIPINLATNTPGTPIPVPEATFDSVTPNGSTLYVQSDNSTGDVYPINLSTNAVGSPIATGATSGPYGLALSPDGKMGYAVDYSNHAIYPINLSPGTASAGISVGREPEYPLVSPDSKTVYTANYEDDTLTPISTTSLTAGSPLGVGGEGPGQISIVPNQGPKAAFTTKVSGATVHLNGRKSSDSDGTVAEYEWSFGDGKRATTTGPTTSHTYKKAGRYKVKLTVVDNEGCSNQQVYTNQELSCNGTSAAVATRTVKFHPSVTIASPAHVKNGTAKVHLTCRGTGPCAGTLTLRTSRTIGSAHFSIKAGKHATVSVHLNSAGRAELASAGGKLSAKATAKVKDGKTTKRTITLVEAVVSFTG